MTPIRAFFTFGGGASTAKRAEKKDELLALIKPLQRGLTRTPPDEQAIDKLCRWAGDGVEVQVNKCTAHSAHNLHVSVHTSITLNPQGAGAHQPKQVEFSIPTYQRTVGTAVYHQ